MLRAAVRTFVDPAMHYYSREKNGSEAEVDYLLAHGSRDVPLQLKTGATGSLKSLHHFMHRRQLSGAEDTCSPLSLSSRCLAVLRGPTPRHDSISVDIGKISHWDREEDIPCGFTACKPLCRAWLVLNGLSYYRHAHKLLGIFLLQIPPLDRSEQVVTSCCAPPEATKPMCNSANSFDVPLSRRSCASCAPPRRSIASARIKTNR